MLALMFMCCLASPATWALMQRAWCSRKRRMSQKSSCCVLMSAPMRKLCWAPKTACWPALRPQGQLLKAHKFPVASGQPPAPSSAFALMPQPWSRATKSSAVIYGLMSLASKWPSHKQESRGFAAPASLKPLLKCIFQALSARTVWWTVHLQGSAPASNPTSAHSTTSFVSLLINPMNP